MARLRAAVAMLKEIVFTTPNFPPLHLTISEAMLIVRKLRCNIIGTALYMQCQRASSSMGAQLTKTVHTARLGHEFVFVFLGCMIYLNVHVSFVLPGSVESFPSCFGAGVTNLNEPPSSFLLPPQYCGLGAGSIPFRAIANNKQCEMRGLFMSLVIHY